MKFIADVNIPQSVIDYLVGSGHDVLDLKRVNSTAKDSQVVKMANADRRIILTLDKDFIVLTQFPKYHVPAIVFRLKKQLPKQIIKYLNELLNRQSEEILQGSLTIIREDSASSSQY